jgi:hypothetical protein
LFDRDRVSIYLDSPHAMDMAIRRDRPIKSLNREKLGEDVLFAFDETKRSLAVCASTKVIPVLFVWKLLSMTYYATSYNFTCSFLMRATGPCRPRELRSISSRGIAKQESQSYMQLSYMETKRLS